MSKGCIIFADRTDDFDYARLAQISAARVEKHLKIPVTLLTTDDTIDNDRSLPGSSTKMSWKNLSRTRALELSPYDRTLLIDADFFVGSDALAAHLDGSFAFAMVRDMYDPVTGKRFSLSLGTSKIPQLWATVMIFDKSDFSRKIFAMADHVICHYDYYSRLYGFSNRPIRNDFAFTIACHLLGGYGMSDYSFRGYVMNNCDFSTKIAEIQEDNVLVRYNKEPEKPALQRLRNMDVHLQDKSSLFGALYG
jgi:hypothetical protein